jgi:diguanylate cyclase (GGDEF)-like protein/PAS domain S-box-containing protein
VNDARSTAQPDGYFESLFQDAPFGYLVTGPDDEILMVNRTLAELVGRDGERLLGRRFRSLLTPGSQVLYETKHLPVVRLSGVAHETLLQLVTGSGSTLDILVNSVRTAGTTGDAQEVRIAVVGASLRVSYEHDLLSAQRFAEDLATRVAVLQNASAALADTESEAQIAETLCSLVETSLVATAVCVAVPVSSGDLQVVAGTSPLAGPTFSDLQELGEAVLTSEAPIVVSTDEDDPGQFPQLATALQRSRLRTVAMFPIMSDAGPLGVAAAFFGRDRTFSESEMDVVLSITRQVSQVLTRVRAQSELTHAAQHDHLTGLANRALVRATVTSRAVEAHADSRPFTLMFIDLDGFKLINDQLGHHVGDAILREVAVRLRLSVRASDLVGRYGGDEFVIVCAGANAQEALAMAQRIHQQIQLPFADAEGYDMSASIGVATSLPGAAQASPDVLISGADSAMYESKRRGRALTTHIEV